MAERAVFYQLTHKFLGRDEEVPEGPQQVIYYSLAIGHHVGVMDCFQSLMEIPMPDYEGWLEHVPAGPAHHKLQGLMKWGEIEINSEHAHDLLPALRGALPGMDANEAQWTRILVGCLNKMLREPALYLMVRKRA
jgi:hydrogenase-4 component J